MDDWALGVVIGLATSTMYDLAKAAAVAMVKAMKKRLARRKNSPKHLRKD